MSALYWSRFRQIEQWNWAQSRNRSWDITQVALLLGKTVIDFSISDSRVINTLRVFVKKWIEVTTGLLYHTQKSNESILKLRF